MVVDTREYSVLFHPDRSTRHRCTVHDLCAYTGYHFDRKIRSVSTFDGGRVRMTQPVYRVTNLLTI